MHIKTALYGFVVNFAIRHYKVPFKTLVDPFLGYLVVGRASPHLPLSSSSPSNYIHLPSSTSGYLKSYFALSGRKINNQSMLERSVGEG